MDASKHLQHLGVILKPSLLQGQHATDMSTAVSQFLNSDIRGMLAESKLPQSSQIATLEKGTLQGSLLVQVLTYSNIAQPLKSESTWQSKRVLKVWLTDGIQEFPALEYRYIPHFDNLMLGAKLLISDAPIRFGLVMLSQQNTLLLGGQVRAFAADQENVGNSASLLGLQNQSTNTNIGNRHSEQQNHQAASLSTIQRGPAQGNALGNESSHQSTIASRESTYQRAGTRTSINATGEGGTYTQIPSNSAPANGLFDSMEVSTSRPSTGANVHRNSGGSTGRNIHRDTIGANAVQSSGRSPGVQKQGPNMHFSSNRSEHRDSANQSTISSNPSTLSRNNPRQNLVRSCTERKASRPTPTGLSNDEMISTTLQHATTGYQASATKQYEPIPANGNGGKLRRYERNTPATPFTPKAQEHQPHSRVNSQQNISTSTPSQHAKSSHNSQDTANNQYSGFRRLSQLIRQLKSNVGLGLENQAIVKGVVLSIKKFEIKGEVYCLHVLFSDGSNTIEAAVDNLWVSRNLFGMSATEFNQKRISDKETFSKITRAVESKLPHLEGLTTIRLLPENNFSNIRFLITDIKKPTKRYLKHLIEQVAGEI